MNNKKVRYQFKIFALLLILLNSLSYGEKVADLPQVMKPVFITMGQGRLYILEERCNIHIYQLKNKRPEFLKTFGKDGEGPGEFQNLSQLRVTKDCLEIPTFGKFSKFSLDGDFIDELKLSFLPFKNSIYKIGENYVYRNIKFNNKTLDARFNLYGPNLKFIKELEQKEIEFGFQRMNFVGAYYLTGVAGNNIYIIDSDQETFIRFYDQNGKSLNQVKLNLKPEKITSELKAKVVGEVTGDMKGERLKAFKKRLYFPDYASALNYFTIFDNKMIGRTYKFKDDLAEFVFFDMKGKELKRMYLYDTGRMSSGKPFCFYGDYYYYIKENPETETWELFSVKVF